MFGNDVDEAVRKAGGDVKRGGFTAQGSDVAVIISFTDSRSGGKILPLESFAVKIVFFVAGFEGRGGGVETDE